MEDWEYHNNRALEILGKAGADLGEEENEKSLKALRENRVVPSRDSHSYSNPILATLYTIIGVMILIILEFTFMLLLVVRHIIPASFRGRSRVFRNKEHRYQHYD